MEKRNLPNATAVLVLGIVSIMTCCCYGIFGLIFAIIAVFLASKDIKLYRENPELYLNYKNLSIGKVLAIIGIVLNVISLIFFTYLFSLGEEGLKEFQENLKAKIEHQQEQDQ